ncbi:hypothetical protein BT63DRAFT_431559 [Microthyrium microscopicum]|uniref:Uncharacterized protein n=1 Tax=Microthyrium microscopicum TaxID=703497 RepID=A0A6A6UMC2_9PEZI|nr:hypothetical protein BT63DRAFT_431559 [Microthyrium microscopicum]
MSMKSDKGESKSSHASVPPKDAIAIVPPKKVIKALYDYSAPDARYLSFSQGDFLHVVEREDDPTWYEACNPLQGTRGLVPAQYFEIVGKQARNSGGSQKSDQFIPVGTHDSGYGGGAGAAATPPNPMRMSKSLRNAGAMVYGVVMYDFKAERPDELDAKEGEAIIVIAQSNPEWFVAKPITRLGGPGLIPVSFIEIRDMGSNKAVEDPQEAVRRAGVPKVEEWKKMAADYKNGSIALGKLEPGAQGMQQGMERMSLNGSGQSQQEKSQQSQGVNGSGYGLQTFRNENLLSAVRASVPRYCFADDVFWFIVEVEMEDGRHWELQRLYQDFYDLQINLIQAYPREAGNVPGVERSLPYMPGPVTYVTDNISNGRRANLDEYIRNLLKLGQHITSDFLVCKFFAPREGDYEIEPDSGEAYRMSSGSQNPIPTQPATLTPPSSSGFSGGQSQQSGGYPGMNGYQNNGPRQTHSRTISSAGSPPPMNMLNQPQGFGAGNGGSPATLIKIKVFFGPENCVIIRMPPDFRFDDLYKKLLERRRLEPGLVGPNDSGNLEICWKDEADNQLYQMETDQDLQAALSRNAKLTLNVRPI